MVEGRIGVGRYGRATKVDSENGKLLRLVKHFISSLWILLRLKIITCNSITLHAFSNSIQQQQCLESKEAHDLTYKQ